MKLVDDKPFYLRESLVNTPLLDMGSVRIQGVADNPQERPVMPESSETRTKGLPRVNKTEISYSAAMLDAEGYITGTWKDTAHMHTEIVVCPIVNTDLKLIEWLQSLWGGRIVRKPQQSKFPTERVCYRLHLRQDEAKRYLKLVKPFLRVKRGQAECALAYISLPWYGGGAPVKRRSLIDRIQELNRSGERYSPAAARADGTTAIRNTLNHFVGEDPSEIRVSPVAD